ncbi:MAG: hypothetical protein ABR529_06420 [Actinomycetota bacterium]
MMLRPTKAVVLGALLAVVAMGMANALPNSLRMSVASGRVSALERHTDSRCLLEKNAEEDGCKGDEDSTVAAGGEEDEDKDGVDGSDDGFSLGQAVKVAARCDLKGPAHGELVRSIAHDKDATVADAEAACEAAMAEAETRSGHGNGNQEGVKGNGNQPEEPQVSEPGPQSDDEGHSGASNSGGNGGGNSGGNGDGSSGNGNGNSFGNTDDASASASSHGNSGGGNGNGKG